MTTTMVNGSYKMVNRQFLQFKIQVFYICLISFMKYIHDIETIFISLKYIYIAENVVSRLLRAVSLLTSCSQRVKRLLEHLH